MEHTVTIDLAAILQAIILAGMVGLFTWVFRLQGRLATFVTMKDLNDTMKEVRTELEKLARDLAYLKGKADGSVN